MSMDNIDLLAALRLNLVLIAITTHTSGKKDVSIDDAVRKRIMGHMQEVEDNILDCSIKFGDKRAVPAELLVTIVQTAGKSLGLMKAELQALTPEQAAGFQVGLIYEPVPDPAGFGMLPEAFHKALGSAVDRRALQNYEEGMEGALKELMSAATFFYKRLTEYHDWATKPGTTRSVLRDAVREALVKNVARCRTCNIANSTIIKGFVDALAYSASVTTEQLRTDSSVRITALSEAGRAADAIQAYFLGSNSQQNDE